MKDVRPMTIFCDIDGTLVEHAKPCEAAKPGHEMSLLPGTIDKLHEWDRKGYRIILTTGRKESLRRQTVIQLEKAGIIYDDLIMGIGGGTRVLINDLKNNSSKPTAKSFCVNRNEGIGSLNLESVNE